MVKRCENSRIELRSFCLPVSLTPFHHPPLRSQSY